MATSCRRSCVNDPNVFCYIYGEYTLEHNRKLITDFVKQAYLAYFKVKLGDQDKSWAPPYCLQNLHQAFTAMDKEIKERFEVCNSDGVARAKRSLQ